MLELGVLAVVIGGDNLRAGLVLGWAGTSGRQRLRCYLALGLAECVLPMAGLVLGQTAFRYADVGELAGPLAMTVCAVLVLWAVARERAGGSEVDTTPARPLGDHPLALVVLPVALGLDNLAAGVALAALAVPAVLAAAVLGLTSSILAGAGLWLGDAMRLRSRVLTVLALLAVAAAHPVLG